MSRSLLGLKPFSARILTSINGVFSSMGVRLSTDRIKSFRKGMQMFFELCVSLGRSSHLMVSITAKFICMGRPSLSWNTLALSYLNHCSTCPSLWREMSGTYALARLREPVHAVERALVESDVALPVVDDQVVLQRIPPYDGVLELPFHGRVDPFFRDLLVGRKAVAADPYASFAAHH